MRRPRSPRPLALLVAVGLGLGTGGGATYAAFSSLTTSAGNTFSAAPDFLPPQATAAVVAKDGQYLAGSIRQGGDFRVYADAADTGSPASGVGSVTADVSAVSAGNTAVPLAAGSWSVNGVTYGYRSGPVPADASVAEGTYAYSLTLVDAAGNATTQGGFAIVVDNTPPTATDVQTANGGPTVGRAEAGDTVTFTFFEPIDPDSILGGWTGAPITVRARITNNGTNDRLIVQTASGSATLPLGTVALGGNYVSAARNFTGSTMVRSGTAITVTLGTPSGATLTSLLPGTMSWTPDAAATDAAGNACATTAAAESGPLDVEF